MGWWSACILGGDTPLDIEDAICIDIAKIDKFADGYSKKLGEYLVENWRHVVEQFETVDRYKGLIDGFYGSETPLLYEIIGYHIITNGLTLEEELKEKILEETEEDPYAQPDDDGNLDGFALERHNVLTSFEKAIEKYDGTAVTMHQEGLFEVVAKGLNKST